MFALTIMFWDVKIPMPAHPLLFALFLLTRELRECSNFMPKSKLLLALFSVTVILEAAFASMPFQLSVVVKFLIIELVVWASRIPCPLFFRFRFFTVTFVEFI